MQQRIVLGLVVAASLLESCKSVSHDRKVDPYVPEDIGGMGRPGQDSSMEITSEPSNERMNLANPTPAQYKTYGRFGPSFAFPVMPIHVILLANGKVLSFGTNEGGAQGAQYNYSVWNPALGTGANAHQLLPNTQNTDIFCSAAAVLPESGNVLIAGGDTRNPANFGIKDTLLFNQGSQALSRTAYMANARWYPTLITLASGESMIYGGRDAVGTPITPPEIYSNGAWRTVMGAANANIINNDEAKWFYPRNWVAPDGRVFGTSGNVMYYLNLTGNGSSLVVGTVPNKTRTNTSTAVMFAPGKILQLGGTTDGNGQAPASNQAIMININGANPVVTNLPNMAFARSWGSTTVLPSGEVLVTGGSAQENQKQGTAYTAEMFNPQNNTFRQLADARFARLYHSVSLLLPDATVLTGGGGAPGPELNLNGEIYYPPYLYDAAGNLAGRLVIGAVATAQTYNKALTFGVTGTGTTTRVTLIRAGAVTHSVDMGQRFLELPFTKDGANVTTTLPANPNLAPPGTYMLFAINENGVPSVAKLITLTGTAVTPPAPVGPKAGTTYQLTARHSNKCATVEGASLVNGAVLEQLACNGSNAQKFLVQAGPTGDFNLVNAGSNKCVTVNPNSPNNGTAIQQQPCTGLINQTVKFVASVNGTYQVRFNNSNKCMDVSEVSLNDGQNLHQWDCVNGANQDWLFTAVAVTPTQPAPPAGVTLGNAYSIIARHSNKCATLASTSTANGTNIEQRTCNGSAVQKFKVVRATNGFFNLISAATNKCVDVAGVSTANGANVYQWDCLNANNQSVKILTGSVAGYYSLRFVHSNSCFDVSGVSTADGANIHQWGCGNVAAANQEWKFQP